MYGLPVDFDASAFVGHAMVQVTFTQNTVGLSFDGDIEITLLSSFRLRNASGEESQTVPVGSSTIMLLLGVTVRSAEARKDGTLTLVFDDESTLVLPDDSKQYESYHLRIGTREIYV